MRTDKELLLILLDNIDKLDTGLCKLSTDLYNKHFSTEEILTIKEVTRLREIISENRPYKEFGYTWYFEPGLKEPRIEFLEKLIANE